MATDPFDSELLSTFVHFSRLYPGLDLHGLRVLWDEAGAFMDEALAQGYEPHEVPALYTTQQPPDNKLRSPRSENEPSNVKRGPWGID